MHARTEGLFKKKELSVTPIANNESLVVKVKIKLF